MSKPYLFLAFAAFAVFACSDDKDPTHQDHCKTPKTKECLVGNWRLNEIRDQFDANRDCSWSGSLTLESNGDYSFAGDYNTGGTWNLNGDRIEINCIVGDCNSEIPSEPPEFAVKNNGDILEVTPPSNGNAYFSGCHLRNSQSKLTEVFRWQGN